MRSNTITKAMIRCVSKPGCTTKLNTSSLSKMVVLFTLFLDILATTSPVQVLTILQSLDRNDPWILKSGMFWSWRRPPNRVPMKISATCLRPAAWKSESTDGLLIENTLDVLSHPSWSPRYAFHWYCMLSVW